TLTRPPPPHCSLPSPPPFPSPTPLPPTTPPFPYTTLFRSAIQTHRPALHQQAAVVVERRAEGRVARAPALLEGAGVVDRRGTPEVVLEAGVPRHIKRPCVVEGRPLPAPQIDPAQARRPGVVDRSLPQLLAVGPAQYQAPSAGDHRRPAPAHVPARPDRKSVVQGQPAAPRLPPTPNPTDSRTRTLAAPWPPP